MMQNKTYSTITLKQLFEYFNNKKVEVCQGNSYFDGIFKVNGRFVEIHSGDRKYSIERMHIFKRGRDKLAFKKPFNTDVIEIIIAGDQ